jgi:hypothetical protein
LGKFTIEVKLLKEINECLENEKKEIESSFDGKVLPIQEKIMGLEEEIRVGRDNFRLGLESLEEGFRKGYESEELRGKNKMRELGEEFKERYYGEEQN